MTATYSSETANNGSKGFTHIYYFPFRTSHDHFLGVVIENLTRVGNQVVDICHYAEINITAIRKILKKFDKRFDKISL